MSQRALNLLAYLDLFDRQGHLLDLARFSDSELSSRLESYSRVRAEALPNEVPREATAAAEPPSSSPRP